VNDSPATVDPRAAARATRRFDDLPGPPGLPLIGNAGGIRPTELHRTLEGWARAYGPLYRFRLGREPVLVVADHRLLAELLRDRPDGLARSRAVRTAIDEAGIAGLFSAEGDRWRRQRRLVMRAMTPEAVRHFFPTMARMTDRLMRRWQWAIDAGRPVPVARDLKAWAMDLTLALSMGQDIDALDHDDDPLQRDVEAMFRTIGRRLAMPVRYWKWFKLPADREADRTMARIGERVVGFVAQTRRRLDADPSLRSRPSNLMEALVAARDEPGSEFTDEDVVGNAVTLVFAGEDTAANTLAWLLHLLATNPDAAARARREVDAVVGPHPIPDAFERLEHLAYVEAAAIESMRLKPVAPLMGFEVLRDRTVGDVAVPKGMRVFGVARCAALDDAHFPDAARFDPERWLRDAASEHAAQDALDAPSRKVFPFGAGPRLCPGRYLAIAEIRMAASMVLRNFDLAFDDDPASVREVFALTMGPDRLPIRLSRRAG
jgi:cytochrome P450